MSIVQGIVQNSVTWGGNNIICGRIQCFLLKWPTNTEIGAI